MLAPTAGPQGPLHAAGSSADLRDGAIDPGDTWFALDFITEASAEIPLSTPLRDRKNGRAVSALRFDPPAERVRVEAGYGTDNQLRMTIYRQEGTIRSVGDRITRTDREGRQRSTTSSAEVFGEVGLPLASMDNTSITGGLFADSATLEGALLAREARPAAGERGGRGRITVDRRAGARLEVTVEGSARRGTSEVPGAMVRRYRKQATADRNGRRKAWWVLEEVQHTIEMPQNGEVRRRRTVTRIENARWNHNEDRDAGRRAAARARHTAQGGARGMAGAASARRASLVSTAPTGVAYTAQIACGPGGPDSFGPTGYPGANLVYQHGICSDASTWSGMRPRVADRVWAGTEQAYSLNDAAPLWYQAHELEGRLAASGTRDNIVIGHSQGGLVARRTGQMESGLVSGVVTISSPHGGAMISDFAPVEATGALADAVFRFGGYCFTYECELIASAANGLPYRYYAPPNGGDMPVRLDNQRGSAFLDSLNSRNEPFRRAGIENDAGPRFAWARLIGDAGSSRDEFDPRGQDAVNTMWDAYDDAYYMTIVGMLLMTITIADDCYYVYPGADYWYFDGLDGCNMQFDGWWDRSLYYLGYILYHVGTAIGGVIDDVDWTWDYLTTRNEALSEPFVYQGDAVGPGTDGFIQLPAQRYPSTPGATEPRRFPIPYAHSHAGETASPKVLDQLIPALRHVGVVSRF
jgi:pimeloyl-ACP methyl ester carboxylesterase